MANFGGFGNDDDGFVPTGAPVFAVVSGSAVSIGVGEAGYAEPLLLLADAWVVPSSSGFAGGILYTDNAQLVYLGQLGTQTVIAGPPHVLERSGLFLFDSVVLDRAIMLDDGLLLDGSFYDLSGPGFHREKLLLAEITLIERAGSGMTSQSGENMVSQSGDNMIPQGG